MRRGTSLKRAAGLTLAESFLPAKSMKTKEGRLVDAQTGRAWVKI